jgi:tetratricopeptide (TPR) repeat protein
MNQIIAALHGLEGSPPDAAVAVLKGLIASAKDTELKAQLMLLQVQWLIKAGKLDDAKKLLDDAGNLLPATEQARQLHDFFEVDVLIAEERYEDALKKLDNLHQIHRAVGKRPNSAHLLDLDDLNEGIQLRRGVVLATLERYGEALPILEEVLSLDVEKEGDFYYLLGLCYYEAGRYDRAREMFLKGFEEGLPENYKIPAHFALGVVCARLGAHAKAKSELEICLANDSSGQIDRRTLLDWLAGACRALGLDEEEQRYRSLLKALKS